MNPVAIMSLKLGLISPEMREQFAQWGEIPEVEPYEAQSHEEISELIERALQSDELVLPKVTNLEVLQEFCASQRLGKLHILMNNQEADFDVVFGVSRTGNIIIPWRSEDIRDVLLDPENAFLVWSADGTTYKTSFRAVEDAYYGDVKAFMLCTPAVLHKKQVLDGYAA